MFLVYYYCMASNTFTRHTITGDTQHTRKGTQGRKPIANRLVKFSARVSTATKSHVKKQAARLGITPSKYADLALALFDVGQELVKQ